MPLPLGVEHLLSQSVAACGLQILSWSCRESRPWSGEQVARRSHTPGQPPDSFYLERVSPLFWPHFAKGSRKQTNKQKSLTFFLEGKSTALAHTPKRWFWVAPSLPLWESFRTLNKMKLGEFGCRMWWTHQYSSSRALCPRANLLKSDQKLPGLLRKMLNVLLPVPHPFNHCCLIIFCEWEFLEFLY